VHRALRNPRRNSSDRPCGAQLVSRQQSIAAACSAIDQVTHPWRRAIVAVLMVCGHAARATESCRGQSLFAA